MTIIQPGIIGSSGSGKIKSVNYYYMSQTDDIAAAYEDVWSMNVGDVMFWTGEFYLNNVTYRNASPFVCVYKTSDRILFAFSYTRGNITYTEFGVVALSLTQQGYGRLAQTRSSNLLTADLSTGYSLANALGTLVVMKYE